MTTKKPTKTPAPKPDVQKFVKFFYDMPAELNRDDMLVYGYIANRCSLRDKMSTATVPTMATALRMSVSTVKRSIRKLLNIGLVELVYSGQEKRVASHYISHPYKAQTEPSLGSHRAGLGSHRAGLGSHRAGLGSHRAGTRVSQSHRVDDVVDVSVEDSVEEVVEGNPEPMKKEERVQEPVSLDTASEPNGSSATIPVETLQTEENPVESVSDQLSPDEGPTPSSAAPLPSDEPLPDYIPPSPPPARKNVLELDYSKRPKQEDYPDVLAWQEAMMSFLGVAS